MEKSQNNRVFSGLMTIQAVRVTDEELRAMNVPPEKWDNARIGYDVAFKGEINTIGLARCIGALIRCFLARLDLPPGVPLDMARATFIAQVMGEARASIMNGVEMSRGENN